ncbi:MAG TPA: 50S ribosomal protein L4 [Patescibacteria group bacterium]|nr:50S ribosomal protein L4 [Patescibacteria group bacterium]
MPEKKVSKVVKKAPTKAVKKPATKVAPKMEKVESSLKVALFDESGKTKGTVSLPEAIFGGSVNKSLMAQAVRVYLANQRIGSAVTKTRSQVTLTTAKWYRQKGTGRARHGAQSAPIFVGGGTAHGPKLRDYSLDLPTKMKKAAVVSALSAMAKDGKVIVVAGLTTLAPKTKLVASAFRGMGLDGKKALLVMPEYVAGVLKAARNIDRVVVSSAKTLNTYEVLNGGTVVVMQEALTLLEKHLKSTKKENK